MNRVGNQKNITYIKKFSRNIEKGVDTINGNAKQIDFYSDLTMDCMELRHHSQETSLTFTRREYNQVTDMMAQEYRHGLNNFEVTRHFPTPLSYCHKLVNYYLRIVKGFLL